MIGPPLPPSLDRSPSVFDRVFHQLRRALSWRARRKTPPLSEEERRRGDYEARLLAALGPPRCYLLMCLGGDWPRLAPAFDPPPGADVLAAFREFVPSRLADAPSALAGAARLLTGDLSGADAIIDNLPEERRVLIGGPGRCASMPFNALAAGLPLPISLARLETWLASSPQQAALRRWLEQHRAGLRWDEIAGVYRYSEPSESDAARV